MDKNIYDITVYLRDVNKKFFDKDKANNKELHFRMLDENKLISILKVLYELHRANVIDIREMQIN